MTRLLVRSRGRGDDSLSSAVERGTRDRQWQVGLGSRAKLLVVGGEGILFLNNSKTGKLGF